MPYGYLGVYPNQIVRNSGILDVTDHAMLNKDKHIGQTMDLLSTTTISNDATVEITTDLTAAGIPSLYSIVI